MGTYGLCLNGMSTHPGLQVLLSVYCAHHSMHFCRKPRGFNLSSNFYLQV